MPVIAISRGSLSGATLLAESVAAELGIRCISREIIAKAAVASGVSETLLAEQMDRPPSIFDRHSAEREAYLWSVRSALCEYATQGSFVYHGHGGHLLLADIPNLIRVGVVAPMEFRIAAVMESQRIDSKAARVHIRRVDKHRDRWVRYLYGADRLDPSFYDLVINLETLDVGAACKVVTRLAGLERFAWDEESRQKVADAALTTRVSAALARRGELLLGRLELTAKANVLSISGQARSKQARDQIRATAERASGEAELCFQVAVSSEGFAWGFEHRGTD
jgi:cytidylate kinase